MHLALNGWFWNRPNSGSGQYTRFLTYYLNRLVSDLAITLICPMTEGYPDEVPPSVKVEMVPNGAGHVGKVVFEQHQFPRVCGQVWGNDCACAVLGITAAQSQCLLW